MCVNSLWASTYTSTLRGNSFGRSKYPGFMDIQRLTWSSMDKTCTNQLLGLGRNIISITLAMLIALWADTRKGTASI